MVTRFVIQFLLYCHYIIHSYTDRRFCHIKVDDMVNPDNPNLNNNVHSCNLDGVYSAYHARENTTLVAAELGDCPV